MPNYGSGLSGQIMLAAETTVGTPVTVTTGYEFLPPENFTFAPTFLDGQGLQSGQPFKRAARTVISRKDVNGDFTIEAPDQGHLGLLLKHALGSTITVPTVIASTAYKQIHTPGTKVGMGLTVQVGKPSPSGTNNPFTYTGVKIAQWDFSVNDGQIAQFKFTCDGWDESTATGLVAASYTAGAGVFGFADVTNFKLGGTPSTSAGETTITSGVSVATVCNGLSLTGMTPMNQGRYGLGNGGVKREQIENAVQTITGSINAELTNLTEFYNVWKANTTTSLQFDLSHGDAGGGNPYLLSFIFPAIKIKNDVTNNQSTDVLPQKIDFEAEYNGVDPVMQIKLVSKDTTL
jgi:hypothetical protein